MAGLITVRDARPDELPSLVETVGELPIDQVAFTKWLVSEQDGVPLGLLRARLVWQVEPLMVSPYVKSKLTLSRASLALYQEMQSWIGDRSRNPTGVQWFFAVTRSSAVQKWASRLGWLRIFDGTQTFIKKL